MKRAGGILLSITSLASPYGIGTLGKAAYEFVDFLREAGQSYWQILPVGPTGYGDSPYQSFSAFAGNPYLIDLDMLQEAGLLEKNEYAAEDWGRDLQRVDYGLLYQKRLPVLRLAADRFLEAPSEEFGQWQREQVWLDDYALFMALKEQHAGAAWTDWEEDLRRRRPAALAQAARENEEEIRRQKAIQYFFSRQWYRLKAYANRNGISLIGDLPIYAAGDSADVWADTALFQLDENLAPKEVAGVPPDGFTDKGQVWGNPLYDWESMKQDGYDWWVRRIACACRRHDVVRIDHFRGFAGYFAVPQGAQTAAGGRWRKGPGMDLFRAVREKCGDCRIIAEDLGYLNQEVRSLLQETGFPGMKVLEFAFDTRDGGNYFPYTYPHSCVCYTGTHDNEPVSGWVQTARPADVHLAGEYLNLTKEEGYGWGLMRGAWASPADLAIVQAQDVLGLGHEARMNTPSTLRGNWQWRALPGVFTPELAGRLHHRMELYGRAPEDL
ncbi:MAG: 4-alpha-glucanotransferase [Lachnospiraceae bacterium]|jgi:4-alpha-glucanotransferase